MLTKSQRRFAEIVSDIIECNPFLPRRIELERKALGTSFITKSANWNLHPTEHQQTENLSRIHDKAESILSSMSNVDVNSKDMPLVADLVRLYLFNRFRRDFEQLAEPSASSPSVARVFKRFQKEWQRFVPDDASRSLGQAPHMFALLFQIRRAFNNTFQHLIGSSPATIELRANVWRSIFTHDMRRYTDTMYGTMADFPTLVTGPTGSGKELVARAIGRSGYLPYDQENGRFASRLDNTFVSLNLSALSPSLIESELFGHAAGSFTGATADRVGWLESCPSQGGVFLDEIGELTQAVQVKLLRVVQDRIFYRMGETNPRVFHGRIIAATNRDLREEIRMGRFRPDLFYRLCADQIETPSLTSRVHAAAEMTHLVEHLMARILGRPDESLTAECVRWINKSLGKDYSWPGNVRELEQCIRSWLIRKEYRPIDVTTAVNSRFARIDIGKLQPLGR